MSALFGLVSVMVVNSAVPYFKECVNIRKMGNKLPKEQQPPHKTENVKPPPPPSNKPAHSGKASPVQNVKGLSHQVL